MNSAVLKLFGTWKVDHRERQPVHSGYKNLPEGCGDDLLARAALFRTEAEILRERAMASGEAVVRNQYSQLADRWLVLAAGLEAELFARLTS